MHGDARMILDLMIDHPGQLLDAGWIADQIRPSDADGDQTRRRRMVSGLLGALSGPRNASQRRYPFYWWHGRDGSPTRYAMKPTVASLFRVARSHVHPHLPVATRTNAAALGAPAVGYRAWSFLSLERTARLAIGETGYPDELGVRYVFDSTVANHGSVKVGDLAVIRDDRVVLGAGWIDDVQAVQGRKIRYRCPSCRSTDFKYRSTAERRFRCAACGTEFDHAAPEDITIRSYSAQYARTQISGNGEMCSL